MVSTTAGITGIGHETLNEPSVHSCFSKDPDVDGNISGNRLTIDWIYVNGTVLNSIAYSQKTFVMPKFETKHIYDVSAAAKAMIQEDNAERRRVRRPPQLSSQSYGWWYDNEKVEDDAEESMYDYLPLSSERYGSWYDHAFSLRQAISDIGDPMLVLPSEIIHWQDIKLFGLAHLSYA